MIDSFPCTQCGACCRTIENLDFLQQYNDNGVCSHLQNNRCTIYEDRPLLCRIDDAYDTIYAQLMSKAEYYKMNAAACNTLQEQKQIDQKFRIDLTIFE